MPLDPAHIRDQKFRLVMRGYDVQAVDAFLERLQVDLAELLADRDTAQATAEPAPASTAGGPRAEGEDSTAARALRTLARAEQMAEQVMADAAAEAEERRASAQAEAEEVLAAARRESGRLEAELHLRRQRDVGALVVEAQRLRAEIERLGTIERRCLQGMQAWLSEQQRALEEHVPVTDVVPAAVAPLHGDPLDPAA
ncbi:DivIVA domain-containing protein [Geodermatophilus sabuli]|uniref:Cell wall synthesis protein Wag31 n=1 Tax=Geodermatophilus sabuli TaxID=1564158 RepID=A0A285EBK3_9ACTN|nr:DivIVA domain-containing protein [Geodermatophilus sabuli]MBB3084375.1 DivIVA domain-containing protein [Geodermatophilus sabuli]SNX96357.1 DivIVA domain-containing protein [Geodermatophilus sabuli]